MESALLLQGFHGKRCLYRSISLLGKKTDKELMIRILRTILTSCTKIGQGALVLDPGSCIYVQ